MKQIFKPVSIILIAFSIWITWVCASLLHFDDTGNLMVHSYSVWGDWSAHFTFINALRERGFAWIAGDNPLFPGIPFQYPFLSHVITYLFSIITFSDTLHATYYLSLLLILVLPVTLYGVLRKLNLTSWGSLAATFSFLLIGGFQWMDSSLKPTEPLTNQFDSASLFTQFILFEFFPQRAFLFGLLAFLACAWYAIKTRTWTLRKQAGLGTLLGLTALLHLHTWIAVATLLVFLFLFARVREAQKRLLYFGLGVAFISGIFLSFLLLRNHASGSRMSWNIWSPGWAQNPTAGIARAQEMNLVSFWIYNTGIFLPLAMFGMWLKRKEKGLYAVAASGIFIFAVAFFFNIQPYYYDNLKLFTYAFLFFTPFVGFALDGIANFAKLPRFVGSAVAVVLLGMQITSATLDMHAFQNGLQNTLFFSQSEFDLADRFKTLRSSPDAIVLINPRHNHWIPCLTGNPVAMGYPGWLWSWGIAYGEREKMVQEILWGGDQADQWIQKLHLAYAAIRDHEQIANRPVNQTYFETHFKEVLHSDGWSVYSLNERTMSPSSSVR